MNKHASSKSKQRKRNQDKVVSRRWRTYALMFGCSLMLVTGFFLAGRQHFSSMDYGIRNSKLRNQVAQLEAEKRRLLLTREMALAPTELKKAAKKIGISGLDANAVVAQVASATKDQAPPPTANADTKPLIVNTASVTSSRPSVEKAALKVERPVKKTTIAAE